MTLKMDDGWSTKCCGVAVKFLKIVLLVEVVTVICDVSSINSKFESGTRKKSIGNGNEKQFILFRIRKDLVC